MAASSSAALNAAPAKPRALLIASTLSACLAVSALLPKAAHALATPEAGLLPYLASFVLHLDKHLTAIVAEHGVRTYGLLFAIVFAETGLVLTPFLPGDSLLFAAGALCAMGSLSLPLLVGLLFVAAVLGDTVNYALGGWLGAAALRSKVVRPEHVAQTEAFFARHGAKTIVLARFLPIVRTFAPFVAGIGSMAYPTFLAYNVGGAALWTASFTGLGFFFGGLPFVKKNFTLVVVAIVVISLLPVLYEVWEARRHKAQQ